MYQKAVALWHSLSPAEKQDWESQARSRHMTGFAFFISQALKPNPGLYLPLQGGTMQGDVDMAGNKITGLPLPTLDSDAASKKYHDDNLPVGGYTEGARAYHSVAQKITDSTDLPVWFNSERYDTDNMHTTFINSLRLTCRTSGKYLIVAHLCFDSNPTGFRRLWILFNGTAVIVLQQLDTVITGPLFLQVTTIYDFVVGDFVDCYVYQNSGGDLNVLSSPQYTPEFMAQRIG